MPLGVLVVNRLDVSRPRVSYLVGQTLMNVGIALSIDYVLRNPEGVATRTLELARSPSWAR